MLVHPGKAKLQAIIICLHQPMRYRQWQRLAQRNNNRMKLERLGEPNVDKKRIQLAGVEVFAA